MDIENARTLLKRYNELFKQMNDLYHTLARHYNLSDTAFWILYIIKDSDNDYTQSELCGELSLSKQTINSALKSLEKEGFIFLQPSEENKRNKTIRFTAEGEKFVEESVAPVIDMDCRALGMFSEEEGQCYMSLFEQHVEQIKKEMKKIIE